MRPKTDGILESSLYVSDLARSIRFYEDIFGFRIVNDFSERGCAMQAGPHQILLLFKKGASRAILASELADWESWLQEKGITIEEKRSWELGGWSIYFRDPDRHLLELATPGT